MTRRVRNPKLFGAGNLEAAPEWTSFNASTGRMLARGERDIPAAVMQDIQQAQARRVAYEAAQRVGDWDPFNLF